MATGVLVPPTAARFAFDVLDCRSVGTRHALQRWRLQGRTAEGRWLLLDFDADVHTGAGAAASLSLPPRLTRVTVAPLDHAVADTVTATATATAVATGTCTGTGAGTGAGIETATSGDSRRGWAIHAEQGRFDLGAVRLFVHEDVSAQAAIAVPPRPVPLGKRLFWRAVFALLATRAGRRWLERRAAA